MNKNDIMHTVKVISQEKGIEKEDVIKAIADAIRVMAKKQNNCEEVEIEMDTETLEYKVFDITGEERIELPQVSLNRVGAQIAKQIINRDVDEATREKVIALFENRIGEMTTGIVKNVSYNNITLDLGTAEAVMPKEHCIPGERYNKGERIKILIEGVKERGKGPYVIASRADIGIVIELLKDKVPELDRGEITIEAASRKPGNRTKIIVASDRHLNPVGAFLEGRGSKMQDISSELNGERIDVIAHNEDMTRMVIDSLRPAAVNNVYFDDIKEEITAVVSEDDIGKALGKRGMNVVLAGELFGWKIKVCTADELNKEDKQAMDEFIDEGSKIGLSKKEAELLFKRGLGSIENVAYCEKDALNEIIGRCDVADIAVNFMLSTVNEGIPLSSLDTDDETKKKILDFNINSCEELAELSAYELDIDIEENLKNNLIIKARELRGII